MDYVCPYCGNDLPEQWTPCCGEVHGERKPESGGAIRDRGDGSNPLPATDHGRNLPAHP